MMVLIDWDNKGEYFICERCGGTHYTYQAARCCEELCTLDEKLYSLEFRI